MTTIGTPERAQGVQARGDVVAEVTERRQLLAFGRGQVEDLLVGNALG